MKTNTKNFRVRGPIAGSFVALALWLTTGSAMASSHMDAPLITLDDAANTTDVYAFVSENGGTEYLSTALAVYPFEEPGIGPNIYRFDDNVRYEIHVALGDDVARGRPTVSYRFEFTTEFKNTSTILQAFAPQSATDVVNDVDDAVQNLTQTYVVTMVDRRIADEEAQEITLGSGVVPPNNQGIVTPFYNLDDDGENPAKGGAATAAELDRYTAQAIAPLSDGYRAFAGQRDDGFYADIQAIFDRLELRSGDSSFDSQGGFNVHTIALDIPIEELGGDMQQVGVYATTSRRKVSVLRRRNPDRFSGRFVQVGRQGNPLFNEGFIAIADKDLYSRTGPGRDGSRFGKYAETPELAALINLLVFDGASVAVETDRSDLVGIFIPDLIRVDLSTGPARLAGGGPVEVNPTNPDDEDFSRLSVFGGDLLASQIQAGPFGDGMVPGGWPNGRRFGDDVVDIAVSAAISDLRDPDNLVVNVADGIDNVNANDIAFSKVFPYAATPLNGRNHEHH